MTESPEQSTTGLDALLAENNPTDPDTNPDTTSETIEEDAPVEEAASDFKMGGLTEDSQDIRFQRGE